MRGAPAADTGLTSTAPLAGPGLRALDWRYLLPRPVNGRFAHLVLFGAAPGVAERVRELGLADRVSEGEGDGADAVVALRGGRWTAAQVAQALGGDGVLYAELRAPWGAARWLRAVGVEPAASYSMSAAEGAYRAFVPVSVRGALPWLLRTRHVAPTPAAVLREHAARLLAAAGAGGVAGAATGVAVTGATGVYQGAAAAALAAARTRGVSSAALPLLLCAGGDRVICLPFEPGARVPSLVVKIPRSRAFGARVAAERGTMAAVRAALPGELAAAIAEPLGGHDEDGVEHTVERYLPGTMLMRTSGRWGRSAAARAEDLTIAASWLTRFHTATIADRAPWGSPAHEAWRRGTVAAYRQCFGPSAEAESLFAAAEQASAAAADRAVPIVWQHRDFTVWNLERDGDALRVLDWEGARPGPPLADLLHLLTSWFHVTRHAGSADGDARGFALALAALSEDQAAPPAAVAAVVRYCDALALDRRLRLPLAVYFATELAVRRADLLRSLGHDDVASPAVNPYRALVGVLARHGGRIAADSARI